MKTIEQKLNELRERQTTAQKLKAVTCEQYFDIHFDNRDFSEMLFEMRKDGVNWSLAFEAMKEQAFDKGIILTDADTFDYETFFDEINAAYE